ncbi:MAG: fatty-acid--CoA ligase [Burkholderiaceae bacterium]|nr:MAG: fatty-acid--CoA ligase [Burkholderiaceae bacterium]
MLGQMMGTQLLVSSIIRHADRYHGDVEIVSRAVEGGIHRYTYCDAHRRAKQLANALTKLGVKPSDRVGTMAWNGYRHLEIYYAVSGMGAICHTINPRLFPEQLSYIINHAEDSYVMIDLTFVPLAEQLAPHCKSVKAWIIMTDRAHMPVATTLDHVLCYEDLIGRESDIYYWPQLDENTASSLCYTSGTTGNPKGVLYSHRSTVLHSYASVMPDCFALSAQDVVMPVVPMFHVNAWGIPYSALAVGAKLVLPGGGMDGASLHELMESEGVTFAAGVPTIWLGLLNHVKETGAKFNTLRRTIVGGSTCPPTMIRTFMEDYKVSVIHAWGMTETSPLGTVCTLKAKHKNLPIEEKLKILSKQGFAVNGITMKIVDKNGKELPRDGKAFGDLMVMGPWVVNSYYKGEGGSPLREGRWFPTGDVATIDADGYMQITDRSKDVIKSGGEWISSIELENIAMAHPAIAEAAVIGVAHPKWDERPLVVAVKKPGLKVSREELLGFYEGKIARWWTPDDVAFVESLPHTGTGKLLKMKLREDFADYKLPTA